MPEWLRAGIWGLIAGSALLIGAAVGDLVALGRRVTAYVMAFGSGVLIAALSFDLMAGAYRAADPTLQAPGSWVEQSSTQSQIGWCPATGLRTASGQARNSPQKRAAWKPAWQ
jgi:hypothetical protein